MSSEEQFTVLPPETGQIFLHQPFRILYRWKEAGGCTPTGFTPPKPENVQHVHRLFAGLGEGAIQASKFAGPSASELHEGNDHA